MQQYKLEWMYKSGSVHYTYANTIEIAEEKAKNKVKDKDIILITITKCELVEVLKNTIMNCDRCKYNTAFGECSCDESCTNFEKWEYK